MGDSFVSKFLGEPLMRRKTANEYPPFFLEDFLSGIDNGRDKLIEA